MSENVCTFEQAMKRLQEIVRHLEQGDTSLEKSLELFEEGAGLIKVCSEMLNTAEQKVSILKNGLDGLPVEEIFDADT